MSFVPHFVGGAYVSRKVALKWLKEFQPRFEIQLKIHRVKRDDCFLYYVVY